MTQVSARGIKLDADGLGIVLRSNGIVNAPVPVVLLDVNDGFKTITATADAINHHPSGGYTDIHYVLSEKVYFVDKAIATGITNAPLFADKMVAKQHLDNSVGSQRYPFKMTVGVTANEVGYDASNDGRWESELNTNTVHKFAVNDTDGSMAVEFGDGGLDKVAEAISVFIQGVAPDDGDENVLPIRLEWSTGNNRYELAASTPMEEISAYLVAVEGATVGINIVYHF